MRRLKISVCLTNMSAERRKAFYALRHISGVSNNVGLTTQTGEFNGHVTIMLTFAIVIFGENRENSMYYISISYVLPGRVLFIVKNGFQSCLPRNSNGALWFVACFYCNEVKSCVSFSRNVIFTMNFHFLKSQPTAAYLITPTWYVWSLQVVIYFIFNSFSTLQDELEMNIVQF